MASKYADSNQIASQPILHIDDSDLPSNQSMLLLNELGLSIGINIRDNTFDLVKLFSE